MERQGKAIGVLVVAVVALVSVGGCSDSAGTDGSERVTLSFAANAGADNVALPPITRNGHTVEVSAVHVRFAELTLERAEGSVGGGDSDGDSEADSDSDGSANERFWDGGVTVAIPVSGGVITPITRAIPRGVYEELELDIDWVRLRGTYDGEPFDVTVQVDYELEAELEPLLELVEAADRPNLTISFSVSDWFIDSNGQLVDPRLLEPNTQLRSRLVTRIRTSFLAFEDSDRDADDTDSDTDES